MTRVEAYGVLALFGLVAAIVIRWPSSHPPELKDQWHPAEAGPPPAPWIAALPTGEPDDLADRVCRHLEQLGCHQRPTCAGTIRLRQRDHLQEMREKELLAATSQADVLALGVATCLP